MLRAGLSEDRIPGGNEEFSHPSGPALRPIQPLIPWVPGLVPGVKRQARGVDHPLLSSAQACLVLCRKKMETCRFL